MPYERNNGFGEMPIQQIDLTSRFEIRIINYISEKLCCANNEQWKFRDKEEPFLEQRIKWTKSSPFPSLDPTRNNDE